MSNLEKKNKKYKVWHTQPMMHPTTEPVEYALQLEHETQGEERTIVFSINYDYQSVQRIIINNKPKEVHFVLAYNRVKQKCIHFSTEDLIRWLMQAFPLNIERLAEFLELEKEYKDTMNKMLSIKDDLTAKLDAYKNMPIYRSVHQSKWGMLTTNHRIMARFDVEGNLRICCYTGEKPDASANTDTNGHSVLSYTMYNKDIHYDDTPAFGAFYALLTGNGCTPLLVIYGDSLDYRYNKLSDKDKKRYYNAFLNLAEFNGFKLIWEK